MRERVRKEQKRLQLELGMFRQVWSAGSRPAPQPPQTFQTEAPPPANPSACC